MNIEFVNQGQPKLVKIGAFHRCRLKDVNKHRFRRIDPKLTKKYNKKCTYFESGNLSIEKMKRDSKDSNQMQKIKNRIASEMDS